MKYILATVLSLTTLGVLLFLIIPSGNTPTSAGDGKNVTLTDGVQTIDLAAKGGFSPNKTVAKAGVPTTLKVATNGTLDCSSTLLIPSMHISEQMQPTGTDSIDLGSPAAGTLQGTCGMGMYKFEIDFQ